jgi:hypothetical protein
MSARWIVSILVVLLPAPACSNRAWNHDESHRITDIIAEQREPEDDDDDDEDEDEEAPVREPVEDSESRRQRRRTRMVQVGLIQP